MKVQCVWEHNGNDSLLYAVNYPGAFTRGSSREEALQIMPVEIDSFLRWAGEPSQSGITPEIVQRKESGLTICDADSDVLFDAEKAALTMPEYRKLKALSLKSAQDFLTQYQAIPEKNKSCLPPRTTFYGQIPRTAAEMYEHTKNVNEYYFGEIGVPADNEGSIVECRARGFSRLECRPDFLDNRVILGSYDEEWTLRKVLRRFIWHDRIHAKAMYRMAIRTFGPDAIPNVFQFQG